MFNKTKNILLSFVLLMLVSTSQFNVNAAQKKTVYVTIERSTLGQSLLLEPVKYEVDADAMGDQILTSLMDKNNIQYKNAGSIGNNFYLASIINGDDGKTKIPNNIKQMPRYSEIIEKSNYYFPNLNEKSYSSDSGWMYTVNNEMATQGMSTYPINDNSVIRLQFSVIGLGADLGDEKTTSIPALKLEDKTTLIKKLANINAYKNKCFKDNDCQNAYKKGISILSNHQASKNDITNILKVLNNSEFLENNIESKHVIDNVKNLINKIPTKVTLKDKTTINNAKKAYDALSNDYKKRVDSNSLSKLNNALTTLKKLENVKPLPKNKTYKKGNTTYYQYLSGKRYITNKTVYKKGSTTTTTYYKMIKGNNKVTKKQTYVKYKKKNILTYYNYIKYYSNGKVKQNEKLYKDKKTNKYTKKNKTVYRSNGKKSKYIAFAYKRGKATKRTEYVYNKVGKTRSDKHGKAYRYITKYNKKGKATRTDRKQYNKKGKLSKNKKVAIRKNF